MRQGEPGFGFRPISEILSRLDGSSGPSNNTVSTFFKRLRNEDSKLNQKKWAVPPIQDLWPHFSTSQSIRKGRCLGKADVLPETTRKHRANCPAVLCPGSANGSPHRIVEIFGSVIVFQRVAYGKQPVPGRHEKVVSFQKELAPRHGPHELGGMFVDRGFAENILDFF